MNKSLVVLISILVLVLGGVVVLAQTQNVDVDGTVTRVMLDEDGNATISIEVRTRLDTQEEEQAFTSLQTRVEEDPDTILSGFRRSVEGLVERAENSTGRSMQATNFSVNARVDPLPVRRGVVTYTFSWSNFASTEEALMVDTTLAGYILSEGDSLVITYPERYSVANVSPQPTSTSPNSVSWTGPRDFASNEPRLQLETVAQGGSPISGPVLVIGAVLLLVLVALIVYVLREPTGDGGDEDVLSDTDRVMRILEEEGGEIKQKKIADETGWSAAKVSQITSNLEEEGRIEKLRMGRENIIKISEE